MFHAFSLIVSVALFWLLMSGIYEAFILTLGVISVFIVVIFCLRMDVVDHESAPIEAFLRWATYTPWLLWQIVLANIDVAKRVLSPTPNISPTLVRLKASQKTDIGKVVYANSITLTPGTVSVSLDGDEILVHALSKDGADDLLDGEMDRRVTAAEGTLNV